MQQAEQQSTQAPMSPFVTTTGAVDTVSRCSEVIDFLSDAIPALGHGGFVVDDEKSHGIAWILNGVAEALRYAESEMQPSKGGE